VKLKKTATTSFTLLQEAYGENILSRALVSEWHRREVFKMKRGHGR
jgi:hypothetical protein